MIPDNESIGSYLKRIREEKKMTIEEVASALNLKKDNIEAIESDTIINILPPAYARGFIRNYAEILELDRHEIIEKFDILYRKETPRIYVKDVGPLKPAERRQKHNKSILAYLLFILVLAAIAVAVWYHWHQTNKDSDKKDDNSAKESMTKKSSTEMLSNNGDEPGKGTIPVVKPVIAFPVQVNFSRNTKIKARLDGTDIYGAGKVFGPGVTEYINAEKSLILEIDEAANVTVLLNDKKIDGLPSSGKVRLTFDSEHKDTPKIEAVPIESPL